MSGVPSVEAVPPAVAVVALVVVAAVVAFSHNTGS
jgi:hypothetical protein